MKAFDKLAKRTEVAFRRRVRRVKNVGRKGEVGVETIGAWVGEKRREFETSSGGKVEQRRGRRRVFVDRIGEENARRR